MDCQAILARMPAAVAPVRLFRLRPVVVGCLAVLLWITGILQLVVPGVLPDFIAPLLVVSVTVLVMPDLTRSLRAPLTLCVAALAGLTLHAGQPNRYWLRWILAPRSVPSWSLSRSCAAIC
jgi:hypothetical protein